MCEYSTPQDIEFYYQQVARLADRLSPVAPETAEYFKHAAKEKKESPFMILYELSRTLIRARRRRISLP